MISDGSSYAETIEWLKCKPGTAQALEELRAVRVKQQDLRLSVAYLHQYIRDALDLSDFDRDPDFLDPEYGQEDYF